MRDLIILVMAIVLVGVRFWWEVGHRQTYEPGQRVRLEGRIAIEPETAGWSQTLSLGDFWVEVPLWPIYEAGERVTVVGVVKANISANRGNPFIPKKTVITATSVEMTSRREGLAGLVLAVRRKADQITKEVLPDPQAGLLSGIVWGGRQGLPREFLDELKRTGTMHVVAASGMNVTLVAQFLISSLVVLLTRRRAIIVGISGILIYVVAAGGMGQPSVVRAGIMATVYLLAQFFGRQYEGLRLLIGVGVVMLIINPFWVFEIGWQLSIAATAGLMIFGTWQGEIWIKKMPSPAKVRIWSLIESDFKTSVAATLATLPVMVGNFGQLSVVAPLVNGLVLWVVAPLMTIGLLILPLGLIWLPLAQVVAWAGWAMLSYFVYLIDFFGKLPWAAIEGISFPWWLGVGYYGLVAAWFIRGRVESKTRHGLRAE